MHPRSIWLALTYLISIYLVTGGTILLIFFFITRLGWGNILYNLIPAGFSILVLLFFIITGLYGIRHPRSVKTKNLLVIALLIQSIQLVVFGFGVKNFFGPYLAIGFTDTPALRFIFSFKLFAYLSDNGLNRLSNEISLVVNLLPLLTIVALNKLYAGAQKPAGKITI